MHFIYFDIANCKKKYQIYEIYGALSNLVWLKLSLLAAEGWARRPPKVPSAPSIL